MKLIKRLLGKSNEGTVVNATSEKLCCLMRRCPICDNNLYGHQYSLFAVEVIEKSHNELVNLFQDLLAHSWENLKKKQNWDSAGDNLEIFALRCASDRLAVLVVRSPFELYEPSSLITTKVLTGDESTRLHQLIRPNDWHSITD